MDLGLDPALATFAGTHPWIAGGPIHEARFQEQFYGRFDYSRLAQFYLRHPGRFVALVGRTLSSGLTIRPAALGNFEKSAGRPKQARSRSFALWSDLHGSVLSHRAAWFLALVLALAAFPWLFWRRAAQQVRVLLEFQSAAALLALAAFLAITFVQGDMDATRVMLPVDLLLDFAIIGAAAELAGVVAGRARRRRGARSRSSADRE